MKATHHAHTLQVDTKIRTKTVKCFVIIFELTLTHTIAQREFKKLTVHIESSSGLSKE